MDNRGYGSSGYSNWGGGGSSSSRGSGGYDLYGYKDSMSSSGGYGGGYGGGGGTGQMKRGLSGGGMVSTGTSADAVIAKINQRLDMLTQLEGSGGMKGGGRSDRFDQYESYDSRPSSVNPRDLYRSGSYGYGEGPSDLRGGGGYGGGAYDGSSFGPAKARQPRDSYSSPGWGGRRSPRRGGAPGGPGGRGFARRQEPPMGGGGGLGGARGGHSPGGRGRLPSLLSHRMYPETGAYQPPPPGPQDLPSGRPFGAGPGIRAGRQRGRKRPVNRQINPQREVQKKRKQTVTPGDEPESKMGKTETENTESTNDSTQPSGETSEGKSSTPAKVKADDDALTMQEEINQMKKKLQTKPPSPPQDRFPKLRKRRGFQERSGVRLGSQRVMFACSVCKFRSFYSDEMAAHMESRFHKDHFRFLSNQLTKPTIDFLQEYLNNKWKKTEERTKQIENISAAICQVYKEQDLTRDIGMEHFMKKVEAAHCAACDLFIPMQHHLIQRHLKSPDHNFNRKGMMEQSKHASLSVARSILNHKVIAKKLESYLKGENPFNGSDKDPEDSLMDVSGAELEKSQATVEDGEGDSNHAPVGEGQNDGAEVKMEEEELEGVLGEDCLEGEEEGNEGEAGLKEEGEGLKEEEAETKEEAEAKVEEEAVLNEDEEEGVEGVLGEDEEGEEGIEGDFGDGEEQGVEGDFGDGEEGVEGDLGEDDEGVEEEEEEGVEVEEEEEEGVQGEVDDEEEQDDDVAVVEDDDGVVLVE
ncbi:A-kinase anchor protein 8-like isoform X2 [Anguilla anguilla]|uniref:A-kinase anchor protein 8-like isoform X2 n=1 Tax=Anguilla anguilla TaxID=7936 RepID=UPI0015AAC013|nr:A-kinase anchor protein 8-like isoform X2 [Anguilla anguilla]